MYIPPLKEIHDIGAEYMVASHRFEIIRNFEVDESQIPTSAREQILMLRMLKATDEKKYNKLFDEVVRKISYIEEEQVQEKQVQEEQKQTISQEIDIQAIKKKLKGIFDELKTELSDHQTNMRVKIEEFSDGKLDILKEKIPEIIKEELEKIRKVVIEVKTEKTSVIIEETVHENFQTVLDLAANRVNVLMVGPAGCGKTHLAASVAKALGADFSSQSCSAGISESVFAGWLLPTEAGGQFEYVQSEFVRIYENGGVFLFDEIDAADANVLLFLNQALANGGFHIPQRFKKPYVKKHPDFIAIAAANTYGSGGNLMYSGRNLLDGASMDRFRAGVVTMDYSNKIEEATVDGEILKIGRKIRQILKNKNLRKIMSTRFLQDASKMKKYGWNMQKIFASYFQDWSEQDIHSVKGDLNGIF